MFANRFEKEAANRSGRPSSHFDCAPGSALEKD